MSSLILKKKFISPCFFIICLKIFFYILWISYLFFLFDKICLKILLLFLYRIISLLVFNIKISKTIFFKTTCIKYQWKLVNPEKFIMIYNYWYSALSRIVLFFLIFINILRKDIK